MKYHRSHLDQQRGFTIVELMVATLVFSVILVVVTTGVIQITRKYYKGITATDTQTTARHIMDAISQSIQFDGGDILAATSPMSGRTCIGQQAYDFQIGQQVSNSPTAGPDMQGHHALTFSSSVPAPCLPGSDPTVGFAAGTELLSPHMRLGTFSVSPLSNNFYMVSVTVIYGDVDQLCSPTFASTHTNHGGCNTNLVPVLGNIPDFVNSPDIRCKIESGSQFCAVSALSTIVQQRLVSS